MILQDLDCIFATLDVNGNGYIEWLELQTFDEQIYFDSLDIEQLEAAIDTVCGRKANGKCRKEYFPEVVNEIERRHVMEEKVAWDFRALDVNDIDRISLNSALFLFRAVHGDKFSHRLWTSFLESRVSADSDVCFDEIKIHLCNVPEFASGNSNEEYLGQEKKLKESNIANIYKTHNELKLWEEDEEFIAAVKRQKIAQADKLKNHADNLLNRMDEIGMEALLEDHYDDAGFGGRAKDKVTATELLDALKLKYEVLRDKVFHKMLQIHIGEGMWHTLSEYEQQEKVFQLKLKEEKLRKEEKLETMAIHLPGSRSAVKYNVFGLMGESVAEFEKRKHLQEEKVQESGLSSEEVEKEFMKKLDDKEKENSSTEVLLVDINNRYILEKDILSKRLQGLDGYSAMNSIDRETYLFALVQARLRGFQESQFYSCGISIGLSERIHPRKDNRLHKDHQKHCNLSLVRLTDHKKRRSHDGPVVPPRLFPLKSKLGRVDLTLQLVQETERRYALERAALLSFMSSKECVLLRISARKLSEDERNGQLSVLLAQRQGWRAKESQQKISLLSQSRKCLEEAVALKIESMKLNLTSDTDVGKELLSLLQMKQDEQCRKILNVGNMEKTELEILWKEQTQSIIEEWFDNIAVILFNIVETSEEEDEVLRALDDKYDTLRDKLLMESLMNQYGKSEWDKMSEQERQNHLAKMRLLEKKLRKEGKYDELQKLFGDAALNSDAMNKMLGENRQKYLDQLNKRLRNRQRRIDAGEDPDDIEDELLTEMPESSSGNILKDLSKRYDDERDAVLRKLRDEQDRNTRERDRQSELARLRLEARRAGREANFDSAALVLGLAERNKAALEDRLKNDRERHEQLARERLAARRRNRKSTTTDVDEKIEPAKDNVTGWQDCVIKELEHKHEQERNIFVDMLQDKESQDFKEEARSMKTDERNERLNKLKAKRNELDFGVKLDQEEHMPILEMATSVKYIVREEFLKTQSEKEVLEDDITISLIADLQQAQDEETRNVLESIPEMSVEELVLLRDKHIEERKCKQVENIAAILFQYDGVVKDEEMVKALDKKYDALLDKLALEALKKQMSDAEWANLSEKDRQKQMMKLRLEQKRLLKEGKFDEAARLLGDGFQADANLKQLMGENKKKYDELLQERLRKKRERLANGETIDDMDRDDGIEEDTSSGGATDAKSILQDLQHRYDDEKEALMARLHGADAQFLNERERQAELARLRREQRCAEQEEKFGAAAMMLGLAERNNAAVEKRLKNDRARHESLAKERLERLRNKRSSQQKEQDLNTLKEGSDVHDGLMKIVERRHAIEQEDLVEYLQNKNVEMLQQCELMAEENRNMKLQELKLEGADADNYSKNISEMVCLKFANRQNKLTLNNKPATNDDVIVSIMADLQQRQDKESDILIKTVTEMSKDDIIKLQDEQIKLCEQKNFPNLLLILALSEVTKSADDNTLLNALELKYDALKDKLIVDGLVRRFGKDVWNNMTEDERNAEVMKIKLEQKQLIDAGKKKEAEQILIDLFTKDYNVQSLLGSSTEEQEKRLKERLELRKQRKADGLSDEEIAKLEAEEDKRFEEEFAKTSNGNVLLDLEKNFESEKETLMKILHGADSKLNTERQRQLELARLRREARKAKAEEKFDAAALVLGMAKSQQAALNAKMNSDRSRQEQLARERLQARKKKRAEQQEEPSETEEIIDKEASETNDLLTLQENVLGEMEKKHTSERQLLMKFIQEAEESEWKQKAKEMTSSERKTKLFELKECRKQWREFSESPEEQVEIFKESVSLKIEEIHQEDEAKQDEDIEVKLLADLQDSQDREAEYMMNDLADKNAVTLKQLVKIQQVARQMQWYDNVAAALLGIKMLAAPSKEDKAIEDEIVEALKEKYDALKEKIYEEALRRKFGDEEWDAMSEKERQEHIAKMKSNEELDNHDSEMQNDLDSVTLPGMDKLIGKTRAKQEQKFKDRMERRKKAKAEGKNMEEIEAQEKEEEEEENMKKGSDVLKDLEDQFASEKDAILAMLMNSDTKELNERERQLALAQLRREKMRIKREEKYDGAAILLSLANKNKAKQEESYENERARQEQLARERILARQKKRKEQREQSENEKLNNEESVDEKDDMVAVEQIQREGTIALQDSLLAEMEKKHTSERDVLMDMVQSIQADSTLIEDANQLSDDDRKEKLNLISLSRNKLKVQSRTFLSSQPPENTMTEEEKNIFNDTLATGRSAHAKILKDGMILTLAQKKKELTDNIDPDKLNEEVSVLIMADLQEKQTTENHALMQALTQMDREMIERLKNEERKSRRAGVMDNIAMVVFGAKTKMQDTAEMESELEKEEEILEMEAKEELAELEKEMEEEKQKKLVTMSEDEVAGFMKEIQRIEAAKKAAIQSQVQRQKEIAKQRLAEKRRKRDDKEYEGDLATAMVANAQKRTAMLREKTMAVQGAQKDSLEERLRRRREERKRKEEEAAEKEHQEIETAKQKELEEQRQQEEQKRKAEEAKKSGEEEGKDSTDQPANVEKSEAVEVKKKKVMPPLPGGGMKREKTVVEQAAMITDNKKKEMINVLMREQTSIASKISKEQSRQEERVQALREKRRKKMEARNMEAAAVLGLGERQKTMVEDRKKGERERQIGQIRERVNRIKYERTMTVKEPQVVENKSFANMAQSEPDDGLTEDEKMQRIAREMERKFKEGGVQSVTTELSPEEQREEEAEKALERKETVSHGKLDAKARAQILKERQKEKKRRRVSQMPTDSPVQTDNESTPVGSTLNDVGQE